MNKKVVFFILITVIVSCTNNKTDNNINKNFASKDRSEKETSLRQCISEKDTTIDSRNAISYVIIDSFYTLKVKVGGLDTLLSYQFNCSVPRGLVPSFHSFYENTICLIRGHGFDYREFLIGYINDNKIILKHYETALTTDLKNDLVVYRDYNHQEKIIVEDIKKQTQQIFFVPSKFATYGIPNAAIIKQKLELKFSDGNVIYFSLR